MAFCKVNKTTKRTMPMKMKEVWESPNTEFITLRTSPLQTSQFVINNQQQKSSLSFSLHSNVQIWQSGRIASMMNNPLSRLFTLNSFP
jgi:hypothetical protein